MGNIVFENKDVIIYRKDPGEDSEKLSVSLGREVNVINRLDKPGTKNGERVLAGIKNISFDGDDLDNFKITYDKIRETIEKEDTSLLPRPKTFENQALEIAPKAQRGKNTYDKFLDKENTDVCFMLNKQFVNEKINTN